MRAVIGGLIVLIGSPVVAVATAHYSNSITAVVTAIGVSLFGTFVVGGFR